MAFSAIILAAGKGTRLKSKLPKALHQVAGRTLIGWVHEAAMSAGATKQICVISKNAQPLIALLDTTTETVIQNPPKGTGHAVKCCLAKIHALPPNQPIIILYADTPLILADTISALAKKIKSGIDLCLLGFNAEDPTGYGRIVRSEKGVVETIIEHDDASASQKKITLVNGGVMAVKAGLLAELLPQLKPKNSQKELYLTDIVALAAGKDLQIDVLLTTETELAGVNDKVQLAQIEASMQNRLRTQAMQAGVTLQAPETIFLCADTRFGTDVVIEPHVVIGQGVSIADNCHIKAFSHLEGTELSAGCCIGPYARLRPGTSLGKNVKIGNFVETKNAIIANDTKASHLSYLGDARIGARANIGAGTITCNYDGFNKFITSIGDDAFVGSNTALVAPVTIGKGTLIGAGSVITKNVDDEAIGITRLPQKQIDGGAKVHRKKARQKKSPA